MRAYCKRGALSWRCHHPIGFSARGTAHGRPLAHERTAALTGSAGLVVTSDSLCHPGNRNTGQPGVGDADDSGVRGELCGVPGAP